ncbi:hypothetical protein CV769_05050 [Enterococcus mundtii]|nr:hypothetical protein CV769_05050 [Enterococcus mundtii]
MDFTLSVLISYVQLCERSQKKHKEYIAIILESDYPYRSNVFFIIDKEISGELLKETVISVKVWEESM